MEKIFNRIMEETHIALRQIKAVAQLLDDKNMVPFADVLPRRALG